MEDITTSRAEEMRRGTDFQNLGSKLWLKKGTPPVAIVKEHSQCQPTAHIGRQPGDLTHFPPFTLPLVPPLVKLVKPESKEPRWCKSRPYRAQSRMEKDRQWL